MAHTFTESKEQQLINIAFSIALTVASDEFTLTDRDDIATWVALQLKECGFPTRPMGASWGVLVDE